jgi:OTT_1508-like deaminase
VLPPAEESIKVLSSTLEILNLRCSHIASDEITRIENWGQVKRVYKEAQPGRPAVRKTKIRFTQHCEITLALDMLKRTRPIPGHSIIEIGVSKACCEWCCEYLNLLTSAYQRNPILVRASHGKQPNGWMMPPSGPQSISQQMVRLIVERVDDVVWKITSSRRSDSNELPSFTKEADSGTSDQAITKNYSSFQTMIDS